MKWVTRERPKIDRLACPWLIRRFIDPDGEILYVPAGEVMQVARELTAIPFDVPGVELSHDGPHCSFDAFLKIYELQDPPLHEHALILRAADTDTLDQSPQAPGLLAISLGLGANLPDDPDLLQAGILLYDALYTWCRSLKSERHINWWKSHSRKAAVSTTSAQISIATRPNSCASRNAPVRSAAKRTTIWLMSKSVRRRKCSSWYLAIQLADSLAC
jgi:hypothetical protein